MSEERGGNSKCFVISQSGVYSVLWVRSDWEEPVTEAQKRKAEEIISSYLFGRDYSRLLNEAGETGE